MTLRVSSFKEEGVYQASKYLKLQVLCDAEELRELFTRLGPLWIYLLTGLHDGEAIGQEEFLAEYGRWIEELKKGRAPADGDLKKMLASAWTEDLSSLWKQEAGGRYIVKMASPVIQVQAHYFTYSRVDGVFRPMTMGQNQIFWGLQFSYPQVYQDPKTMEMLEPEGEMFNKIRKWARDMTRATPFVVDGVKTNVPIRLGKNCFEWIANHPQLKKMGILVDV